LCFAPVDNGGLLDAVDGFDRPQSIIRICSLVDIVVYWFSLTLSFDVLELVG